MGRTVNAHFDKLLCNFIRHGGIALNNPGRHLSIPIPGGVLHQDAVRFFCTLSCHTNSVVITQIGDGRVRVFLADIGKAFRCRTFWHIDDRTLSQLVSSPRYTASMVAICCSHQSNLTQFLFYLVTGHDRERQFRQISSQTVCDILTNRKGSTQHLKSIETKPIGLILHKNIRYSKFFGRIF